MWRNWTVKCVCWVQTCRGATGLSTWKGKTQTTDRKYVFFHFFKFAPIRPWIWLDCINHILVWLEDWCLDLLWFALYWLQPEEKHCCSWEIFHFQRDILCHMLNFWHESLSFKGELIMKLAVRLPGPEPENWGRSFYMLHCLLVYSCVCIHYFFHKLTFGDTDKETVQYFLNIFPQTFCFREFFCDTFIRATLVRQTDTS